VGRGKGKARKMAKQIRIKTLNLHGLITKYTDFLHTHKKKKRKKEPRKHNKSKALKCRLPVRANAGNKRVAKWRPAERLGQQCDTY